MSDIFVNHAAQAPFFRWRVSILRDGAEVGLFKAKVFVAQDDPLLEVSSGAKRLRAVFAIPVKGVGGWNDVANPPRTGDICEIHSGPSGAGLRFAVQTVQPLITHVFTLEARQCSQP